MQNIAKKIIAIATVLSVSAMVAGPAQALTAEELQAQITALQAQLLALQQQLSQTQSGPAPAACSGVTSFDRNLKQGMTGSDVKCLQGLLNQSSDTRVAASGAGSPGNETTYFGALTRAAVVKFQEKYAAEILTPLGLTAGTGFVGSATRAKLNSLLATTPSPSPSPTTSPSPTPVPGVLTVALASDTPASGTIATAATAPATGSPGAASAVLVKYTFTNGSTTEAKVTGLKLKRLGVSADTTLPNVYLYNGATRLTDSASVSSGIITFNDSAGLFKVAANSSMTVSVAADIAAATSGQTVGVGIQASTDITSNATSVSGTFPMNGNLMSIATATLATVDFNATTTPSTATITPQNDYTVWQNIITVGNRAVNFNRLALREIGSINYSDLQNFRLYVDGVQVGSTVANLDANGYVTFDLSAAPKKLETGARTIKVLGDIIGGSSRNFSFSLRVVADAVFVDTEYGANVSSTASSSSFSARTTGTQSVGSGVVTITKKSDSPAGNVVSTASGVTLAKYEIKASGEKVKIEWLRVAADVGNNAGTAITLRNGLLRANGVQIGSSASLYDISNATATYTQYSLGSSLIVEPGSPVTLEIVADIFDNEGTNNLDTTDDTITARIVGGDLDNAQGLVSSTIIDAPATNQLGNSLTISQGGLTLAKYTAYPDTTMVPPVLGVKLAHFTLTSTTTEAVNLNTISVDIDAVSDEMDASDDLTNLYVKYGTLTTSVKATVSDTANSWSINYQLAAGATIDVTVYADAASTTTDGTAPADTARVDMTITGTTVQSAASATTGEKNGQVITFGTGSITSAVDGSTPAAQVVAGNQTVTAAKFKFTAASDSYTIKEVKAKLNNASATTISGAITNVILKDGTTVLGTKPLNETSQVNDTGSALNNSATTFTGLSVPVAANTTKTLTVDVQFGTISANYSTSQVNAAITLDNFKNATSQGVEATDTTDRSGNALFVYASVPTVAAQDLSSGQGVLLSAGSSTEIYKVKVSADAKGDISLKQMKFSAVINDAGSTGTLTLGTFKLFRGTTDVTSYVTIQDTSGNSLESTTTIGEGTSTVVVAFDDDDNQYAIVTAGSSQTYILKATPSGFITSSTGNDSVSTSMLSDASAHNGTDVYAYDPAGTGSIIQLAGDNAGTGASDYNLIWSDRSALSHSDTSGTASADFANGYLVQDQTPDSRGVVAQ